MDYTKFMEGLEEMKRIALQQQEALKDAAVREAIAGGAAVIARPEQFLMPVRAKKGQPANVDPWFNYNQWEWQKEIDEGFDGWHEVNEGSGRNKRMINYEAARAWFEKKRAGQQSRRAQLSSDKRQLVPTERRKAS